MKYRKKPIVVEAVQWDGTGESHLAVNELSGQSLGRIDNVLYIPTLEGKMSAQLGDYIIRGVRGELYPCKPDIFAATYEAVE